MKLMSILILSMILLLSPAGTVLAAEEHEEAAAYGEKEVDGYKVTLTFAEGDAKIGHNNVHIQVHDPQGQTVANASVSIIAELYDAPAQTGHEGMDITGANHSMTDMGKPVQTVKVNLTAGAAGEYEGEVELNKAGSWILNVVVGLPQIKSVMFPIDLVKSGPNWYVLSVFLGIIVATIVIGGLTKRKPTSSHVPLPEASV